MFKRVPLSTRLALAAFLGLCPVIRRTDPKLTDLMTRQLAVGQAENSCRTKCRPLPSACRTTANSLADRYPAARCSAILLPAGSRLVLRLPEDHWPACPRSGPASRTSTATSSCWNNCATRWMPTPGAVMVRHNDQFIRVATLLKDKNGQPQTGVPLSPGQRRSRSPACRQAVSRHGQPQTATFT